MSNIISNTSENLRVAGMVDDSITDGPGLRFTLFLQGCNMNCPGCHNPDALDLDGGTLYSVDEIIEKINKNPLLSGVTFSGGEPLLQAESLILLAEFIKNVQLDLAIYTGYTFEDLVSENNETVLKLLSMADVLIDGKFKLKERSLSLLFRGSENQRILNLPQSLKQKKAVFETDLSWIG